MLASFLVYRHKLMPQRYHGKCLKIARGKVKEDDKYTCPICDYRVKIPRDAARPKLEDLIDWHQEIPNLPFIPDELDCLNNIIKAAKEFRDFVRPYTSSALGLTSAEVPTMRFYLRKIEGAEILLAHETNFFRTELHRWMPIAPEPPPAIEVSMSTRKPRPTKQQKLMAQMGITNPDDLPPQLRTKSHSFSKKKASDTNSKPPPPIKPAPSKAAMSPSSPDTPTTINPGQTHAQSQQSPSQPHFDYGGSRFGSAVSQSSPTFSQPAFNQTPGRLGSPVLMNNPGRGPTLDPALFNPSFHGSRSESSSSPQYSASANRDMNNIFEALTNHDETELYVKEPAPTTSVSYQALAAEVLDTAGDSMDSNLADQFLQP